MRKEETAVLDWLWYRFTQLVMNQRRVQIASRRPPPWIFWGGGQGRHRRADRPRWYRVV